MTFWIGTSSTSETILCVPQKSSISWVSAMPPIAEPARRLLPQMSEKAATDAGSVGMPTITMAPCGRKQLEVLVEVVRRRDRVEEQVEPARELLERGLVLR